ncbi:MAG: SIS domain-containing protein [Actinomycetota bacterium]
MCGIIGIVRRPSSRPAPSSADILDRIAVAIEGSDPHDSDSLERTAAGLVEINRLLLGVPGVTSLLRHPGLVSEIRARLTPLQEEMAAIDREALAADVTVDEQLNARRVELKDALWAILEDRLAVPAGVLALAGATPQGASIAAMTSVYDALAALDRLEVRGRDSVGLHLYVSDHGCDLDDPALARAIADRSGDPSFDNTSVRRVGDVVSFVYKEAAEIGELGDNTRAIRTAIAADDLLHALLANEKAQVLVLGHTRWASVGIISEANASPINSDAIDREASPYFVAALNGDVDNYADLANGAGLAFHESITTDVKVIPTLVADAVTRGADVHEAFRGSVASFEGSVAIGLCGAAEPGVLHLAQRGSGQALYIGFAEDTYVVASEPYGVVELTDRYMRLDGESPVDPSNPASARGQIATLRTESAGDPLAVERFSYDGRALPVTADDLVTAEITTRDIDRAGYPHFLLKEISESPRSFRSTLMGKLIDTGEGYEVSVGEDTLPSSVRERLADGSITTVIGIGQGTAAVAAQSFVKALADQVGDRLNVRSSLATELSGFGITADMRDTLVVAVSQSGTTTDTNRTVDLVRERGATVVGIVNRRNSDLTDKADGVLYTSDGRDVEMSVASTKAFYSQVAAGFLLATVIADEIGRDVAGAATAQRVLSGLADLPAAMEAVIASRERIGEIAAVAPPQPYWAIVGSGANRIAAEEIRIKLSELCYKAIACDSIEDKKHIDLSSEPMIIVCAAGLIGGTADDAVKEVAIYRAHKAVPIVIANEGEQRFGSTNVIRVPEVPAELGFVLSAVAGHLFGYEAALAIDAQAMPMRRLRASIESAIAADPSAQGVDLLERLQPSIGQARRDFAGELRQGRYDGNLGSSTAVDLAMLLRYAAGVGALASYQVDFGKVGTPAVVLEDLTRVLGRAIDELTRPIDAIKHQAKTVTVGISRSDESLLHVPLVAETIAAGASRDALSYATLRTLAGLSAAVDEVVGHTRYRIEGDAKRDDAIISIVDRSGISAKIPSRVDRDPVLRGTKHRVAIEGQVLVTRGLRDGRLIVLVPEVKDAQPVGITLLHLQLVDELTIDQTRAVLQSYQNRFVAIRDAVLETEAAFDEQVLAEVPIDDLLVRPPVLLAERWRA